MNIKRITAIILIFICTTVAWFTLGTSIYVRSAAQSGSTRGSVTNLWGPTMAQTHPSVYYTSPDVGGRKYILPEASDISVSLNYDPKKKGLIWHRTYFVDFLGIYTIKNPTPITQTLYIKFGFPAEAASYYNFSYAIDGKKSVKNSSSEGLVEAVTLKPGEEAKLSVTYQSRGMDYWKYAFGETTRLRNFKLKMKTDFSEIDFIQGTGSPTAREREGKGWVLDWIYPDVIGTQEIGIAMPNVLNPGPVAARITYFAPVSLLFFFGVLVIMGMVYKIDLHPMNYFFLAAGAFAFQLLFAYLLDIIPLHLAFVIAAAVSLILTATYLYAAAGKKYAKLAALAQFAYMTLFSYSFFFDGFTGLTITIGAIITLAILMRATAKIDWSSRFQKAAVTK